MTLGFLVGSRAAMRFRISSGYAAADLALARVLSDLMGGVGIEPTTLGAESLVWKAFRTRRRARVRVEPFSVESGHAFKGDGS
jgi:hypothetical protein